MKRTALAASTLSLLSLAALTGCGDDGTDADPRSTAASSPKASKAPKAAEDPTPAERLAKALVTDADVPGYHVEKPDAAYALATSQKGLTTDEAACAPLAYALNALPLGDPETWLDRTAQQDTGAADGMVTHITLATYAEGAAATAMKELAEAANTCGSGFTAKGKVAGKESSQPYTSVTTEKAPAGGDESYATAVTWTYEGYPQTVRTRTFRFGDTIANYCTVWTGFALNAQPGKAKVPVKVVTAQNAKLG
ncbi:hypothetical protein OK074_8378 [Actinobacteria bacterium OK074]|nr:hypothetical protein OK074_8378 [Actinobacteria bacterium OK074]